MNKFFITIGHSSLNIPEDIMHRINPNANLLELAEPGLIEICDSFPTKKVIFNLHRAILDVNRSRNNIDPKTNQSYPIGRELFPVTDFQGNSIYKNEQLLDLTEQGKFLELYYDPYFQEIDNLISTGSYDFFIDIHLMNNDSSSYKMKNERPDINIGNLGDEEGEICSNRPSTTIKPEEARNVKQLFENEGLSCKLNRPFAGGFIMMRYLNQFPCFQLEINKRILTDSDDSMSNEIKLKKLVLNLKKVFNNHWGE